MGGGWVGVVKREGRVEGAFGTVMLEVMEMVMLVGLDGNCKAGEIGGDGSMGEAGG